MIGMGHQVWLVGIFFCFSFEIDLGGFQFMVLLLQPPEAGMVSVRLVVLLGNKSLIACAPLNFT